MRKGGKEGGRKEGRSVLGRRNSDDKGTDHMK